MRNQVSTSASMPAPTTRTGADTLAGRTQRAKPASRPASNPAGRASNEVAPSPTLRRNGELAIDR